VENAELVDTGFQYDRHWMLVDDEGQFLSQRQQARMATILTRLENKNLIVSHAGMDELRIPLQQTTQTPIAVKIWGDTCQASLVSDDADDWFREVLQTSCRLVFLPQSEPRQVDQAYASPDQIVGFADGFPLLVMTLASAAALSEQLGESISIERFRPNIVLDGCAAHAEDDWARIRINEVTIDLPKPCSRCVIPSIDQNSAEKHPTLLKTLAAYRRRDGKVYVGQNGLHRSHGRLSVGNKVFVDSNRNPQLHGAN
jgi:uncharacterized protein YcbX